MQEFCKINCMLADFYGIFRYFLLFMVFMVFMVLYTTTLRIYIPLPFA